MDERRRKRDRDAQYFAPSAQEIFTTHLRAGEWFVLHNLVSENGLGIGSRLGASYVGGPTSDFDGIRGDFDLLDIYFGEFSHDLDRKELGFYLGFLYNEHDVADRITSEKLGLPKTRLGEGYWIVIPVSEKVKEKMGRLLEASDYFMEQEKVLASRDEAWKVGLDWMHKKCYEENNKVVDGKHRGLMIRETRRSWPKGQQCYYCKGKTIRVKHG